MILRNHSYSPPFLLYNGHIHTIYASKFRKSAELSFDRHRWHTPDEDFIDIDFLKKGHSRIVIIGHGLEGHSQRPYITNTAALFTENDWDICAWNSRSCSGEMNLRPKLYSHGDTDDLQFIIRKLIQDHGYKEIALVGFSMGGAIILNLLGKMGAETPNEISAAVAISTPLDIEAASLQLENGFNKYYRNYFMNKLKEKMVIKADQFPGMLETEGIERIKRWKEFDERFSAPLGDFDSAEEFYFYCSAIHRLHDIHTPTLLINALDDPLLTLESYAEQPFAKSDILHALYTRKGGHVAFIQKEGVYSFAEEKAHNFIESARKGVEESFCKEIEKL